MSTASGSRLRLVLALIAGACLLLGTASSASASTSTAISGAKSGDTVALTSDISLVVGSISTSGDATTLSDATLQLGKTVSGTGVSGTLTGTKLTLTGGRFTVPKSLDDSVYTIKDGGLVFDLGDTGATNVTGELAETKETAAPTVGLRAFAGTDAGQDDIAKAIPAPPAGGTYGFDIKVYVDKLTVTVKLGGQQIVYGQIRYNASYWFDLTYPFSFKGQNVVISGRLEGTNIFQPATYKVSGAITGQIELTKGVYITGGNVSISQDGISFGGSAKLDCATGGLAASVAGTINDEKNWKFSLSGATTGGCVVSKDLALPAGDITGDIESVDGSVTGAFEVGGKISTTLLPAGVNQWDARFRFIYDGTDAGSYIAFYASAGIGTAQGKIQFDGTFALNADFTIPFGGSNVAFRGDLKRTAPSAEVIYDVSGAANIAINSKTSLGGSLKLTNTSIGLSGNVTLACPVSGSITGGVSGSVPIGSGKDWSFGISGGAGANGCQITKEFGLAAGTNLSGSVKSVAGVVSVAADANATITTNLIPTKTSFSVGFSFAASQGDYSISAKGSTQGAGFSMAIASDSTFNLSFNLDDLALGGVTLGAKGTIKRATPGAAVTYSISGALSGQAKIYDNLYLRGGSLSIDSKGGLSFSGTVRQICTTGYLDASAKGIVVDSRNWAFDAKGIASSCTIGRAAKFDGTTFYAQIKSEDAKVLYNAGVQASRINLFSTNVFLLGPTTTWLTGVGATISNTCTGCLEGKKTRLSFGGTGNASFRVLIFVPVQISVSLSGQVDIMGNSVRKVSLALNRSLFLSQFAQNQIEIDTETAFTTA